jgi:serine/threonine-protein kinase
VPAAGPGLQDVLDRCLQKDPAHRYANVAELARALAPFGSPQAEMAVERIEHVLGVSGASRAAPAAAEATLLNAGSAGPAASSTLSATSSAPRGRSRLLLVSAPLVLLGAAGALVLVFVLGRAPASGVAARDAAHAAEPPASTTAIELAPLAPDLASAQASAPATGVPTQPAASATATATATASSAQHRRPAATPSHAAPAAAPPSASASAGRPCRLVSYLDADGEKHFRQECP